MARELDEHAGRLLAAGGPLLEFTISYPLHPERP